MGDVKEGPDQLVLLDRLYQSGTPPNWNVVVAGVKAKARARSRLHAPRRESLAGEFLAMAFESPVWGGGGERTNHRWREHPNVLQYQKEKVDCRVQTIGRTFSQLKPWLATGCSTGLLRQYYRAPNRGDTRVVTATTKHH